jgi:hypothetical protein
VNFGACLDSWIFGLIAWEESLFHQFQLVDVIWSHQLTLIEEFGNSG